MTGELEFGTEKVWVRASPQLLKQMLDNWSQPVRVKATVNPMDGSWDMVFQVDRSDSTQSEAGLKQWWTELFVQCTYEQTQRIKEFKPLIDEAFKRVHEPSP